MEELNNVLELIYKFGVLPILLIIIYKLYKFWQKAEVDKEGLVKEIRTMEQENTKLLYKLGAILSKLNKKIEKE